MSKIHLILGITILLFIVKPVLSQQTKWQTDKYNFNNIENLSNIEFLYNSKGKLFYLLTNDKNNLYIHIRAVDEIAQKKIIIYGFTIEIKTKGPNKKKLIIEYPLPKKDRMEPIILLSDNSNKNRKNFNLIKDQIVKQIVQMRITGLTDKKSSITIAANNKLNINGNMIINKNGDLQYLLVIPLNSLSIDLSENTTISLKMLSGSLDLSNISNKQSKGRMGINGRSGRGRAQGMSGGQGGRGKGQGGRPEYQEQRMSGKQELTTSIKIIVKKLILLNEE